MDDARLANVYVTRESQKTEAPTNHDNLVARRWHPRNSKQQGYKANEREFVRRNLEWQTMDRTIFDRLVFRPQFRYRRHAHPLGLPYSEPQQLHHQQNLPFRERVGRDDQVRRGTVIHDARDNRMSWGSGSASQPWMRGIFASSKSLRAPFSPCGWGADADVNSGFKIIPSSQKD